ncbi:MAG TPA: hypothetical protein VKE96_12480 [Vicinamibacterales bacterium]|nr:hypothetical protein [Vicinamibacterales bacterium]
MKRDDTDPAVTHLEPWTCPACGDVMTAVGTVSGEEQAPEVGDSCACMHCGQFLVFHAPVEGEDLRLRPMTEQEYNALPLIARAELARTRAFSRQVWQPSQGRGPSRN